MGSKQLTGIGGKPMVRHRKDVFPGITACQTEPYPPGRLDHLAAYLKRPQPELLYLQCGKLSFIESLSESQHKPICCHMQKEPELVGKEAVATQTIRLQAILEFYDLLISHKYQGNYRELRNILMAAVDSARWDKRYMLLPADFEILTKRKTSRDAVLTYKDIMLKDIFSHADNEKAKLVAAKIQEVIDSGKDIKTVLTTEHSQEGRH